MGGHVANTVQAEFAWFEDDDVLELNTQIGADDEDLVYPDMDTNYRLRFLLQNDGSADETDGYILRYSINAGVDYIDVTAASSYVRSTDSVQALADGDATAQRIGVGAFDEGDYDESSGVIASYTLTQAEESEHEFCIQFRAADIDDEGETILLRLEFDDGTDLDGYTVTPSTVAANPANPSTTNLISWWTLDEESGQRDDSHGSNDLTDNNTVLFAGGKQSNAALFVWDNVEYLSIADNASISVGNIDFTFGGWYKLTDKDSNQTLCGQYITAGNQRSWQLYYLQGSDQFEAIFSSAGDNAQVLEDVVFGSPGAGTWYFILLWHDATGDTINMQINDGGISSEGFAAGVWDSTGFFSIGGVNGAGSDSTIDECFFYKRLLTAGERLWLYNSASGRTYSDVAPSGRTTKNTDSHPLGLHTGMGWRFGNP